MNGGKEKHATSEDLVLEELETDINSLRLEIALKAFAQGVRTKGAMPDHRLGLNDIYHENYVLIAKNHDLDIPAANNRAELRIYADDTWRNEESYIFDDGHLHEYALVTSPVYQSPLRNMWNDLDNLDSNSPEGQPIEDRFEAAAANFVSQNKISLMTGLRSDLQKALVGDIQTG